VLVCADIVLLLWHVMTCRIPGSLQPWHLCWSTLCWPQTHSCCAAQHKYAAAGEKQLLRQVQAPLTSL